MVYPVYLSYLFIAQAFIANPFILIISIHDFLKSVWREQQGSRIEVFGFPLCMEHFVQDLAKGSGTIGDLPATEVLYIGKHVNGAFKKSTDQLPLGYYWRCTLTGHLT